MLSIKSDSDRLRLILLGILCTGFICVVIALCMQMGKAAKTEEIPIEQLLQQYWQEQLAAQPANEAAHEQLPKEMPALTQVESNADAAQGQAAEDQAAKDDDAQEGQADQGGTPTPASEAAEQDGKIDINRATAEQLQQLKGIGPSKASAIIEDRERKGSFKSIGDIKRVKGIGEKLFAGIQDSIVANP